MNVRCPSCQTVFRVDPDKIPAAGIRARCAKCQAVFRLSPSGVAAPVATPVAAAAAPVAAPTQAVMPPPPPPPPSAPAIAAAAPAAAPTAASRPTSYPRPSFRNQDPGARAQRIARALVSDIVAYNKERLQGPVEAGTLRNEFREEIRKSWEEYVEQVGLELARHTPYFRDALNEILAKGQKIF